MLRRLWLRVSARYLIVCQEIIFNTMHIRKPKCVDIDIEGRLRGILQDKGRSI